MSQCNLEKPCLVVSMTNTVSWLPWMCPWCSACLPGLRLGHREDCKVKFGRALARGVLQRWGLEFFVHSLSERHRRRHSTAKASAASSMDPPRPMQHKDLLVLQTIHLFLLYFLSELRTTMCLGQWRAQCSSIQKCNPPHLAFAAWLRKYALPWSESQKVMHMASHTC